MILGLTGKNASGKGEIAKFLIERGFKFFSLSDEIRESLKRKRIEITRESLTREGNRLREEFGPDILARIVLEKITPQNNYVVDSFRNPYEVKTFRKYGNFFLIFVDADPLKRFERIKKREREEDPQTYEDFLEMERREFKNNKITSQQLLMTEELRDFRIENNTTIKELHKSIKEILKESIKRTTRPSWDKYFMDIAMVVATRSNCIKRKVGAIIVYERRIISTGYNGTPRGVKNCNEGGCKRCEEFGPSGSSLNECICSHAEENSIVQSAFHGVSVKGSTLYTTYSPCFQCAKMIINAGIKEVVYGDGYPMLDNVQAIFTEAGVKLRTFED